MKCYCSFGMKERECARVGDIISESVMRVELSVS